MFEEKAQNLSMLIESNINIIIISSLILFIGYIVLRVKRINMMFIADIYVLLTFIFILGVVIAPHRYYYFAYFIVALFR